MDMDIQVVSKHDKDILWQILGIIDYSVRLILYISLIISIRYISLIIFLNIHPISISIFHQIFTFYGPFSLWLMHAVIQNNNASSNEMGAQMHQRGATKIQFKRHLSVTDLVVH